MNVLLASPRGFCAGVDMAIECLKEAIRCVGPGIFVYHEIAHNRIAVDRFEKLGVTFVETLDDLPEGSVLVFSDSKVASAVSAHRITRNGGYLLRHDESPGCDQNNSGIRRCSDRTWQPE